MEMENKKLLETLEAIGFRVSGSGKSFYIRKNFKTVRISNHLKYNQYKNENLLNYIYKNENQLIKIIKKLIIKGVV